MLKNLKNYLLIGLLVSILSTLGYFYLPKTIQVFDDKIRDLMFMARGVDSSAKDVVIVDIDE